MSNTGDAIGVAANLAQQALADSYVAAHPLGTTVPIEQVKAYQLNRDKALGNAVVDNIGSSGGGVPVTRKVNGHELSSDVTVTAFDVGLGNANNTSDANKPIGTATATALGLKLNANDTSVTNARAPTAHATIHTSGSDQIAEATVLAHGLMSASDKTKLEGVQSGAQANTTSNSGTTGVGLVLSKDGVNLPFKSIAGDGSTISVTDDPAHYSVIISYIGTGGGGGFDPAKSAYMAALRG
jgi:hypothetical protein